MVHIPVLPMHVRVTSLVTSAPVEGQVVSGQNADVIGFDPLNYPCQCKVPQVKPSIMTMDDEKFRQSLSPEELKDLLSKQAASEKDFDKRINKFRELKDEYDKALSALNVAYVDYEPYLQNIEDVKVNIEHAAKKCRWLDDKFGLFLPCNKNIDIVQKKYNNLRFKNGAWGKPHCVVGASLPMRPLDDTIFKTNSLGGLPLVIFLSAGRDFNGAVKSSGAAITVSDFL